MVSLAIHGAGAAATTVETHGWWLASRASGLVALVLITISVGLGLAMAGKVLRRPGLSRKLMAVHEQTALAGLVAIAVHGITLLGDPWLRPGVAGVTVPLTIGYRPLATALGIVAAYTAALLGLSFYFRKRIGAKLWRKAHRATVVVYALGLAHAFTAGSDASAPLFRWWAIATGVPIAALFLYRLGAARRATRRRRERVVDDTAPARLSGRSRLETPSLSREAI
jgi:sulfoxide reductase heme-binding subunit YedZ